MSTEFERKDGGGGDWLDSDAATEVLSMMIFTTGPMSELFRSNGHDIPRKAEAEQAFILRWLLKLVAQHGADWKTEADKKLSAMKPADS